MTLVKITKDIPGIATLTLNRPEKRNALSTELMESICASCEMIHQDEHLRVLILRGEGPVFCAGLDLQETLETVRNEKGFSNPELITKMLLMLYESPLVTIALVQGAAIAGGAGIMSACDFVVAAEGAKFGYPETRRGLVAAIVMPFLRRQLRERDARELLLLADLIDATRALEMGLVSGVVPESELMDTALKIAEKVMKGAPRATTQTKIFLDLLWGTTMREDVEIALNYHREARFSDEATEGIRAFLEKRAPSWVAPH